MNILAAPSFGHFVESFPLHLDETKGGKRFNLKRQELEEDVEL